MRKALSILIMLALGACADERLAVVNDQPGTWAKVINVTNGETVIDRLDAGHTAYLRPDALVTYASNTSTTSEIHLLAVGYRQGSNCPLGSVDFVTSISASEGGGPTGAQADVWHINGFNTFVSC